MRIKTGAQRIPVEVLPMLAAVVTLMGADVQSMEQSLNALKTGRVSQSARRRGHLGLRAQVEPVL